MKRNLIAFFFLLFFAVACQNKPYNTSENNIDAARNFIRAALDGKFREAREYMLQDSVNTNYMDVAERAYERADQTTKNGYKASSIRIYSPISEINDSTSVIIYSNSYKNDPDTLKVIKQNGQWLVDLKYLYLHNMDTLFNKQILKDSLHD